MFDDIGKGFGVSRLLCLMLCTLILGCVSATAEELLVDDWRSASINKLKEAQLLIENQIALAEMTDQVAETKPAQDSDNFVLYEQNGVLILWNGLSDTLTSGLDFNPALYIENKGTEVLNVDPSSFYVNGYRMSVSNAFAVKLEGGTRIITSTTNSWLLSAEDLIDVYGCSTIDNFTIYLTIKNGDTILVDNQKFSVDTQIDISEMMGNNSYFIKKYPED